MSCGGAWRSTAGLFATLAIAVCLSACGGGDDTTAPSGSPEAAGNSAGTTTTANSLRKGSEGREAGGGHSAKSRGSAEEATKEEGPEGGSSGESRYGTVSPASAGFQKYSGAGKLHLAEFGTEASSGDRKRVQTAVDAYLQATGKDDWEAACAYLSAIVKVQIEDLVKGSEGFAGNGCGEALHTFVKAFGKGVDGSPIYAPEGIASLRLKEEAGAGFALFRGSDGKDHWIAVKLEGGDWKVLSTTPQPFR